MQQVDLLVIGGGPPGMSAALSAKANGVESMIIVERNEALGGILNQCIHNGFGLNLFKEELTGPEFACKFIDKIEETGITYLLNTTVVSLSSDKTAILQNSEGIHTIKAKAVIIATGCRERPRGAINIPGSRPAGIYSAGTAQKLINCCGYMPGKKAVILGSGDIGLIMARRLTLEGAEVKAVCEIMPYSSGLTRNIIQCLNDFNIPLYLSHTVTRIFGRERVNGVEISAVDKNYKPVKGTEKFIECDTLLLSVGLIPENELSECASALMDNTTHGPSVNDKLQTSIEGIFSCGNALHVHDLADYASQEAEDAGRNAAIYVKGGQKSEQECALHRGFGIGSAVPQRISNDGLASGVTIYLRVREPYEKAHIEIKRNERIIKTIKSVRLTPGEIIKTVIQDKSDGGDLSAEVIFDK